MENHKNQFINLAKILKILFSYKKRYIFILLFFAITNSILPFISLFITQNILNIIQSEIKNMNLFWNNIIMYILISIFIAICNSIYAYYSKKYYQYLYYHLNKNLLKSTEKLSLRDYENSSTYDMLQRAEQEIGLRPYQIIITCLTLLSTIITISTSAVILYNWHKWSIIIFLIMPFISFKYFSIISKKEYEIVSARTTMERESWYVAQLLTKDTNAKEIKSLNLSNHLNNKFSYLRHLFMQQNLDIEKRKTIFSFIYKIVNLFFTINIAMFAMVEAIMNKIAIGNLMTYINTTSKVENSITIIVNSVFSLYTDLLFSQNIINFYNYIENKKLAENTHTIDKSLEDINTIEFINVSYKYPNRQQYALKNISFKLEKGDCVALVGENGSGKSTLIKILTGLYDDYEGYILINGKNFKNINKDSLLDKISIIFQDYIKFQFTVKENIFFGNIKNNNYPKIKEAAKISGANIFIENLPNKYNQQIGHWFKNGTELSGGQWQKLAIARMFMKKSDVFVLDEPTSALDPKSELKFYLEFKRKIQKKIIIFATHKFINLGFTNKIIVLDKGKIVELGSHENLIKKKQKYYDMYTIQKRMLKREEKNYD